MQKKSAKTNILHSNKNGMGSKGKNPLYRKKWGEGKGGREKAGEMSKILLAEWEKIW